jgi:hypothetical protein
MRRISRPVVAGGGLPDPLRVRTRDDTRAPVLAIRMKPLKSSFGMNKSVIKSYND